MCVVARPRFYFFFFFDNVVSVKMANDYVIEEEDAADTGAESHIWKYFADISGHGEKGGSKNVQCKLCDRNFTGMSTTRAVAHILGQPVMGQATAGIKSCIAIKTEEGRRLKKQGMGLPLLCWRKNLQQI